MRAQLGHTRCGGAPVEPSMPVSVRGSHPTQAHEPDFRINEARPANQRGATMSGTSSATTITEHEAEEVARANATGLQPVVFIHGLWLLPSSWDRWATVFEEAGFTTLTPGWPDDPETVEEANAHPEVFAKKTVGQVADHFEEIVSKLDRKPIIIGHSFG